MSQALPGCRSWLSLEGVCRKVDGCGPHSPGPGRGDCPASRRDEAALRRVCRGAAAAASRSAPSVRSPPPSSSSGHPRGLRASRMLWVPAFPVLPEEGPWPSPGAMACAEPPPAPLSARLRWGSRRQGPRSRRCAWRFVPSAWGLRFYFETLLSGSSLRA